MDCKECKKTLKGQKYVEKDADTKYCIPCHEKKFSNRCSECKKVIGVGQKDLSYGDHHYHEACFACQMCKLSLADKNFEIKQEKRYCSKCLVDKFGPDANKCPGCKKEFAKGEKKMEYKGKHWHDACFSCNMCKQPIGSKSFYPRDDGMVCETCYNDKVAKKCAKCDK